MGRHRSRRDDSRERSRRRRHRSSSSSASRERIIRKQDQRIRELESLVKELTQSRSLPQSQPRGWNIRSRDELMIPLFDPSKNDAKVEKWVEQVDGLAEQYDWDDRDTMRLIVNRLRGHAQQWYETRSEMIITWKEMKKKLILHFRKFVPFRKLFEDAALYKAQPGQALGDYCRQKMIKLQKLNLTIPDEYQIDVIIGGIEDENIARTIRSTRHTDVKLLYAYMITLGNIPGGEEPQRAATATSVMRRAQRCLPILSGKREKRCNGAATTSFDREGCNGATYGTQRGSLDHGVAMQNLKISNKGERRKFLTDTTGPEDRLAVRMA